MLHGNVTKFLLSYTHAVHVRGFLKMFYGHLFSCVNNNWSSTCTMCSFQNKVCRLEFLGLVAFVIGCNSI